MEKGEGEEEEEEEKEEMEGEKEEEEEEGQGTKGEGEETEKQRERDGCLQSRDWTGGLTLQVISMLKGGGIGAAGAAMAAPLFCSNMGHAL